MQKNMFKKIVITKIFSKSKSMPIDYESDDKI